MSKERDRVALHTLNHGGECTLNWHEEGGGLAYRLWDTYILFEVPQFGGDARYAGVFTTSQLDELLNTAHNMT